MSKNIIEVRNLGKKYIINHQQNERYTALRDVMVNKVRNFGKNKLDTGAQEEFWALKNISFDIKPGDKVGIIGRNGAGKSTLLKLLSRITEPTTGSIKINGRVASLLEVGTGFHPELTGRENIFLNGAILGMSKQEIKKKFDEIVEFAEVEKFLDTPVKRYSSGMYVRLAFSVAAHLEPEILIVDEVLAVGDAQFQRKCLGKMRDVSKEGRTVLFVSHNMGAIQQLCEKGIILHKGTIKNNISSINEIIREYQSCDTVQSNESVWCNTENLYENDFFKLNRISLQDKTNRVIPASVENSNEVFVSIEVEVKKYNSSINIGYAVYDEDNILIYWSFSTDEEESIWPEVKIGLNTFRTMIPSNYLNEGLYRVEMLASIHNVAWLMPPNRQHGSVYFRIEGGLSNSIYWTEKRPGMLAPIFRWEVTHE